MLMRLDGSADEHRFHRSADCGVALKPLLSDTGRQQIEDSAWLYTASSPLELDVLMKPVAILFIKPVRTAGCQHFFFLPAGGLNTRFRFRFHLPCRTAIDNFAPSHFVVEEAQQQFKTSERDRAT